jgi:hypothetical protein
MRLSLAFNWAIGDLVSKLRIQMPNKAGIHEEGRLTSKAVGWYEGKSTFDILQDSQGSSILDPIGIKSLKSMDAREKSRQ